MFVLRPPSSLCRRGKEAEAAEEEEDGRRSCSLWFQLEGNWDDGLIGKWKRIIEANGRRRRNHSLKTTSL